VSGERRFELDESTGGFRQVQLGRVRRGLYLDKTPYLGSWIVLLRCPSNSGYVGVANEKSFCLVPKPILDIRRTHSSAWWVRITNLNLNAVLTKHVLIYGEEWERPVCEQTVARTEQLAKFHTTVQLAFKTKPVVYSLSVGFV